jgi:hypothetical protein
MSNNSQWRRDHDIAHRCYLAKGIPQTLTRDSVRRENEFERALEQRGQKAVENLEQIS